ncbi:hypothetical protein ACHAXR_000116, partial [Thalassiosira sp. AJA248-18]
MQVLVLVVFLGISTSTSAQDAFLLPPSASHKLLDKAPPGTRRQNSSSYSSSYTTLTRNISTIRPGGEDPSLFFSSKRATSGSPTNANDNKDEAETNNAEPEKDTIRVRIWRALASGDELSMTQLCKQVGERNRGDLRSHLKHVERQAKTIRNKSSEWRERRGLLPMG